MKTIKRISLTIIFTSLCLNYSQAQTQGTSQISIGYGRLSLYEFVNTIFEDTESSGVFNLGYKYAIKNRFMIGANISYEELKATTNFSNIFGSSDPTIDEFSNITIAIETDYRYISKPSFQMYSGIGLAYFTTGEYDTNFSFQGTALGFRIGKKLAAYAELGFGYKGIAQIGASYQF